MNLKNLNILSKIILFILPFLLILIFFMLFVIQYNNNKQTSNQIEDTKELIYYLQEVLKNPDMVYNANITATEKLLKDNLNFDLINFETYWNYTIFLIAPNGDIFNIIDIMTEKQEDAANDTTIQEPLEYIHNTSENGQYSLLIIETNSFINGTTENLTYDFPDEIINYNNGERLYNFSQNNITTDKNDSLSIISLNSDNYSFLEFSFILSDTDNNFEIMLPLNWFKNLTCQSIRIEA
jgi:hypothetical protein